MYGREGDGREMLRLSQGASPTKYRREHNTLSHRQKPGYRAVIWQVCAAATSNASQFGPPAPHRAGIAKGCGN